MSMYKSLVATVLGAAVLLGSATAQAETQKPQFSKEQAFQMCSMFAYIANEAYKEHQANKTTKVAKQNLYKSIINAKAGKEEREFFTNIIDASVEDASKLPVPKTKQEKEQALKEYSFGVLEGCIEEMGYKVSDFQ